MRLQLKLLTLLVGLAIIASGCELFKQKRHIILIISDGMQLEHEIAASRYLKGKDNGLVFHKFPYKNFVTTWDVTTYDHYAGINGVDPYDPDSFDPIIGYDPELGGAMAYPFSELDTQEEYFLRIRDGAPTSVATDPASAATAMVTGFKTYKKKINWSIDNTALTAITSDLKAELGYAIGVVSTVPFTHATPACFAPTHNPVRDAYHEIGTEMIFTTKPDVVIGGGHPGFGLADPEADPPVSGFEYLSEEDYNALKDGATDYVFAERVEGADGAMSLGAAAFQAIMSHKKLFGLYGGVVELGYRGGAFEHPVPQHNPGCPTFDVETENPALADALKSAFNVLKQDPDGFFLMVEQGDVDWANHFNIYDWMIGAMYDLDKAVKAAIDMVNYPFDDINWSNTTLIVTSDHANSYMRLSKENILGKGELPDPENPEDYVTYGHYNHTNEPVSIYVKGKDAFKFMKYEGLWYPETRLIDDTNIYDFVRELTGL